MKSKTEFRRIGLLKSDLPYGQRTLQDGTVELFNRRYEVIASKQGVSVQTPNTTFFYSDQNPPWIDEKVRLKCVAKLRSF